MILWYKLSRELGYGTIHVMNDFKRKVKTFIKCTIVGFTAVLKNYKVFKKINGRIPSCGIFHPRFFLRAGLVLTVFAVETGWA